MIVAIKGYRFHVKEGGYIYIVKDGDAVDGTELDSEFYLPVKALLDSLVELNESVNELFEEVDKIVEVDDG
jgi:hypothetical protein